MSLTAVKTFLAIVESGSLVRASERLNVTQSTVTSRLKGLEAELGQTLLYRQKTGVTLTSHGFRFKRYAEAIADLWQQARRETSLPEETEAICNLGCHVDLWPTLGRRILDEILDRHPATIMSAWPGNQVQLEHWLHTGLIDVALTYRTKILENQSRHSLQAEELVLYTTSTDSRADGRKGSGPGYIYVDAGDDFGRRYTAAYAHADFARISFGSAVWALEYLLDRGGSAYLPKDLAAADHRDGQLHTVPDAPVFSRDRYLVTNDSAAANWPWLTELVARFSARPPVAGDKNDP